MIISFKKVDFECSKQKNCLYSGGTIPIGAIFVVALRRRSIQFGARETGNVHSPVQWVQRQHRVGGAVWRPQTQIGVSLYREKNVYTIMTESIEAHTDVVKHGFIVLVSGIFD